MMQALLANFIYSRRREATFDKGQEALIHLRNENQKLVAELSEANVTLGKATEMMDSAHNSLEKVEGYKKTCDDERMSYIRRVHPARRHGMPSKMSTKFTRRTFNLGRLLLN